jgi:hypothetical protein
VAGQDFGIHSKGLRAIPSGFYAAPEHRGGGSTSCLSYTDLRGSGSQLRGPAKVNGLPFLKSWLRIVLMVGVSIECKFQGDLGYTCSGNWSCVPGMRLVWESSLHKTDMPICFFSPARVF